MTCFASNHSSIRVRSYKTRENFIPTLIDEWWNLRDCLLPKIVISLDLTKLLECLVWLQRFTSSQCCHQKSFFCLWLEDWSVNSNCSGFIDIPSQLPAIATLTHPFLVTNRARRGDSDVSVITLNISHSVSLEVHNIILDWG